MSWLGLQTRAELLHWQDSEKEQREYAEMEAKFLEGMSEEQLKMYDALTQKVWERSALEGHEGLSADY